MIHILRTFVEVNKMVRKLHALILPEIQLSKDFLLIDILGEAFREVLYNITNFKCSGKTILIV